MKEFGSAYLWAYRKVEKEALELTEQLTIDLLKELANYEKGVCAYCPQVYCEVSKTIECYTIFDERGVK